MFLTLTLAIITVPRALATWSCVETEWMRTHSASPLESAKHFMILRSTAPLPGSPAERNVPAAEYQHAYYYTVLVAIVETATKLG